MTTLFARPHARWLSKACLLFKRNDWCGCELALCPDRPFFLVSESKANGDVDVISKKREPTGFMSSQSEAARAGRYAFCTSGELLKLMAKLLFLLSIYGQEQTLISCTSPMKNPLQRKTSLMVYCVCNCHWTGPHPKISTPSTRRASLVRSCAWFVVTKI